jgi:SAM-dependent methyltransferase/GNAT superfamily N-acetyltransferase
MSQTQQTLLTLEKIEFLTKKCKKLTEAEIMESSQLFSNHYGFYSEFSPIRPGERIRLGKAHYRKLKNLNHCYVAFAKYQGNILGQAYYIKKMLSNGMGVWVTQLVVHSDYRKIGIAKTLLHSIWGFSNYAAWGLATANPLTIKALESVTFRKVNIESLKENQRILLELAQEVEFINPSQFSFKEKTLLAFTHFFPDYQQLQGQIDDNLESIFNLSELKAGYEWIAFTFKTQTFSVPDLKKFERLLNISEHIVKNAYSRMKRKKQAWSQHASKEIDYILENISVNKDSFIADFGCGEGRHLKALYSRGFCNITGYEFSESIISDVEKSLNIELQDCRTIDLKESCDLILCLYDVVGSFGVNQENLKILTSIYQSLKKNGRAVISVLNRELTESIAIHVGNVLLEPNKLLALPASNIMQSSGNIFNPKYFLLDVDTGVVYRKERFFDEGKLNTEYLIRDKRYARSEFIALLEQIGLKVIESRYVQSGKWDFPLSSTDEKAKEILIIVEKV